jgi:hypothetical protein
MTYGAKQAVNDTDTITSIVPASIGVGTDSAAIIGAAIFIIGIGGGELVSDSQTIAPIFAPVPRASASALDLASADALASASRRAEATWFDENCSPET